MQPIHRIHSTLIFLALFIVALLALAAAGEKSMASAGEISPVKTASAHGKVYRQKIVHWVGHKNPALQVMRIVWTSATPSMGINTVCNNDLGLLVEIVDILCFIVLFYNVIHMYMCRAWERQKRFLLVVVVLLFMFQ